MKRILKCASKRVTAVIITTVLLFATVFSMSVAANAATFTPRLSAPSSSNKYYYSNINIFYKYGYGMPNCTCYAFGRAYEILGSEPKLSHGNAEDWYSYNKSNGYYSYGKTAKLGAIACWSYDGGGGHVAVVEKIENGTITFSNSAWSGTNFYLTYADTDDSNAGGSSRWNFQGYIYIGSFSGTSSSSTNSSSSSGSYTTGTYVTNVNSNSYLSLRSGAGTSYELLAKIPDNTTLKVTKIKTAGGYTWGYTSYKGTKGWAALEYCDFVKSAETEATTKKVETTTKAATAATEPTTTAATEPTTTAATEPTTTEPTTAPRLSGDVNLDDKLDISDVTAIQKYIAKITDFNSEQLKLADFDGSGEVNISDATAIAKKIAGVA